MSLHSSLEATVTSTSCSVVDESPEAPVRPHPVTVAVWPVYRDLMDPGRQTGATEEVKVRAELRNSTPASYLPSLLTYFGCVLMVETSRLSTLESVVS